MRREIAWLPVVVCPVTEPKRALITGITGQDGSYLAELLLSKGYDVHGMVRRSSTETFQRLEHIRDELTLHTGDLLDQRSLVDVFRASSETSHPSTVAYRARSSPWAADRASKWGR